MSGLISSQSNGKIFRMSMATISLGTLTVLLLNRAFPVLANSVDPDQLASEEANRSGSTLFVIKYVNFYLKTRNK